MLGRDGMQGAQSAVSLRGAPSLGDHISHVVLVGAEKEVRRAHAGRCVAPMEHMLTFRDRSACQFPCDAVGTGDATITATSADSTVSPAIGHPDPEPAADTSASNIFPESLSQWNGLGFAVARDRTESFVTRIESQLKRSPTNLAQTCSSLAVGLRLARPRAEAWLVMATNPRTWSCKNGAALVTAELIKPTLAQGLATPTAIARCGKALTSGKRLRTGRTHVSKGHGSHTSPVNGAMSMGAREKCH